MKRSLLAALCLVTFGSMPAFALADYPLDIAGPGGRESIIDFGSFQEDLLNINLRHAARMTDLLEAAPDPVDLSEYLHDLNPGYPVLGEDEWQADDAGWTMPLDDNWSEPFDSGEELFDDSNWSIPVIDW